MKSTEVVTHTRNQRQSCNQNRMLTLLCTSFTIIWTASNVLLFWFVLDEENYNNDYTKVLMLRLRHGQAIFHLTAIAI